VEAEVFAQLSAISNNLGTQSLLSSPMLYGLFRKVTMVPERRLGVQAMDFARRLLPQWWFLLKGLPAPRAKFRELAIDRGRRRKALNDEIAIIFLERRFRYEPFWRDLMRAHQFYGFEPHPECFTKA
jgi:hypothetical protein